MKAQPSQANGGDHRSMKATPQILMDKVVHFPDGLPAFEDVRQFIFACKAETAPFIFMRALAPAQVGFACIDPFVICPGYNLNVSEADMAFLDITNPDDVLILSIVNPSENIRLTTANLQSPLVINLRNCRGRQIILAEQNYPVRYSIWDALKRMAQNAPVLTAEVEGKCSAA